MSSDDCTLGLWAPGSATGTWNCSSTGSATPPLPTHRLRIAHGGWGAFRCFKDASARDERSWRPFHRFCDERQHGRARARLAEEGHCPRGPVPQTRSTPRPCETWVLPSWPSAAKVAA